ncbi:MAG TPA: rRNA maturation RNase YbeY [Acidimicrobiales bacterium]|nr:rRNA maturation RNase YbeY [Acidimicrobiales bacterium]
MTDSDPPSPSPAGEHVVFAADEQDAHPVDVDRWARLAEHALRSEGTTDGELSLLFVDEAAMADLNRRFMGADGPTDVLAFPIDEHDVTSGRDPDHGTAGPGRPPAEPDDLPALLGDVVICPAVAARNAPDHAGTYDDELALLVVHGVLHVLGHDHAEPDERDRMQDRERHILATFADEGRSR